MGAHHAISGAAAWIALTSSAPYALGLDPMPTGSILIGSLVTAGAALLPDADHHNGTIAHSGGIATKVAARATESFSGGHRHGLHSLLAILGFYLACTFVGGWHSVVPYLGLIPTGAALLFLALVAFALKALKLSKGGIVKLWLTSFVATVAVLVFSPEQMAWVPTAVVLGVIVHLVGDFLTVGGLPLLWPWIPKPPQGLDYVPVLRKVWQRNGYVALPVLGKTGSAREWLLCTALTGYVLVALADTVARSVGYPLPIPGLSA